jgi:truncated hemoglobin YjbI
MTRLVVHQAKFIASVMGGPPSFTDAELRDAHAHLTISDAIFDEMTDLLEATLNDSGIDLADTGQVMGTIRNKRRQRGRGDALFRHLSRRSVSVLADDLEDLLVMGNAG